jgi:hypothetical protein
MTVRTNKTETQLREALFKIGNIIETIFLYESRALSKEGSARHLEEVEEQGGWVGGGGAGQRLKQPNQ